MRRVDVKWIDLAHELIHDVVGAKDRCGSPELLVDDPSLHEIRCKDTAAWLERKFGGELEQLVRALTDDVERLGRSHAALMRSVAVLGGRLDEHLGTEP